jgi:hypothetical protein
MFVWMRFDVESFAVSCFGILRFGVVISGGRRIRYLGRGNWVRFGICYVGSFDPMSACLVLWKSSCL